MNTYVLDACALIAVLQDEAGSDKVTSVINMAYIGKAIVLMNKVNLLEVYYDVYRLRGKEQAEIILFEMKKIPVTVISDFSDDIFHEAGRIKATYKISVADAFALAQASVTEGFLLTADHHEFDIIEKKDRIKFDWIR